MEGPPRNDYLERLIQDFARDIIFRINYFRYQRYGLDRDDLVQSVYLKICKNFEKSDKKIRDLKSYIIRVVDSVMIEALTRSRIEMQTLSLLNRNLSAARKTNSGHTKTHGDGRQTILLGSLKGLKDSRQTVLRLVLSGLSLEEVAKLQQWSYGKTHNLYSRGLKDLKKRLKAKGVIYED